MANQSKKVIKKIVKTQVGELAIPSLYTRLASSATAQTPKKLKKTKYEFTSCLQYKTSMFEKQPYTKKRKKERKSKIYQHHHFRMCLAKNQFLEER